MVESEGTVTGFGTLWLNLGHCDWFGGIVIDSVGSMMDCGIMWLAALWLSL